MWKKIKEWLISIIKSDIFKKIIGIIIAVFTTLFGILVLINKLFPGLLDVKTKKEKEFEKKVGIEKDNVTKLSYDNKDIIEETEKDVKENESKLVDIKKNQSKREKEMSKFIKNKS